jgi:5-methylcytosine-specific restriction protein A
MPPIMLRDQTKGTATGPLNCCIVGFSSSAPVSRCRISPKNLRRRCVCCPVLVGGVRENEPMTESPLAAVQRLMAQAVEAVRGVAEAGSADERVAVLALSEATVRQLDQVTVATVAGLDRDGVFAERGYRSPAQALSDLVGWERFESHRRVVAAQHVTARVGLDGSVSPARLVATAEVFAAGRAGLRHVEVIARLLNSAAAGRLSPDTWAVAEKQLAGWAGEFTPSELHNNGKALIELLDQDGAKPDERPPPQVNELRLTRLPDGGGKLKGRFEDAAMFDAIAAVIDAKATPLTADDDRSMVERQAEALADVCGYVLDHAPASVLPDAGGHRPHINVLIRLEDLENRATAGCLDFGGPVAPESLRMLCCDAAVVPVVMNGKGQPLGVGRATRTIPDGLRRAVAARDRGCAHPGCGRPVSWCEVHHIEQWELGGETKLSNVVMLCRVHHRQIHSTEWTVRIRDGLPEFIPPKWVDFEQRPRRRALPHLVQVPARSR